jgi:DNA topoisomerase-1
VAARKKTTDEPKPTPRAVSKKKTTPAKPRGTAAVRKKKTSTNGAAPEPRAGKRDLVIVESPAKAKTIQKYLGSQFEVAASYGHVRDLIKSRRGGDIGIDIEAGWVPTYVNLDDDRHRQVLASLKKQSAKAGTVYLAPDPDREGEAIAWHLKEALKLSDERIRRVTFNEITKRAVQDAFAHAGSIDMDRVRAQETRRFLDRVVGFKLSPLLRKKVARGLSAGRVQSVAVRLIVEREREILAFKPEEYWKILALLSPEGTLPVPGPIQAKVRKKPLAAADAKAADPEKEPEKEDEIKLQVPQGAFQAELAEWNGQKFQAKTEQEAAPILTALETAAYTVSKVEQKDSQEKAPAPFTTSTLQQQANIRLGYSAQRTMRVAQQLYEGVGLGNEGQVALITYMRTDSTRISDDALKACREHINAEYGAPYLPAQPNRFASGKSAQEAHEAIRPTDLSYTPQRVASFLTEEQRKVYDLIYRRFLASQMTPAVFALTNVEIQAQRPANGDAPAAMLGLLKSQGKILKFDGYRRVLAPKGKQEDATLPALTAQQKLDLLDLLGSQHFTQPPPRFNEASLVKRLEKEGIGRPSTYATIISKIQERNYVEQRERRFYATELGMLVTDKLIRHFPSVMDLKFTSQMEDQLDQIEERHAEWHEVLDNFWGPFRQALDAAQTDMEAVKGVETGEACPKCGKPLVTKFSTKVKGNQFIGCSGYPECKYIKPREGEAARPEPVETEHLCPTCGKPMLLREGQRGPFLGCSGYPECKTTMNFDAEGKPVLSAKPTEHVCEKCGKPMVIREGRRGPFLACTGYPKCRNAKDVDANGNPVKPLETGIACEKCGKPMNVRRGPRGPFLGCSGYPKCRSTKPLPDELKDQAQAMMPAAAAKKTMPAVDVQVGCPECGAPMKLRERRKGPAGYFLGCSKYPKCKGACEAPPEVLEQIALLNSQALAGSAASAAPVAGEG